MKVLANRLRDLEGRHPSGPSRWHRIMVGVGQSEDQARASHEAEHGLIGAGDGIVWRVMVAPGVTHAAA